MKPETKETCDAIEAIKLPVRYDADGQIIWTADNQRLCDIRGWGFLTGTGGLHLHPDEAAKIQDARGEQIVTALNQYQAVCAERDRYRAALEHYADRENWNCWYCENGALHDVCVGCNYDHGTGYAVAQAALQGDEGESDD